MITLRYAAILSIVPMLGWGHSLSPLTAGEIDQAVGLIRASRDFPAHGKFHLIALDEPPKALVIRDAPAPRRVRAVIYDLTRNQTVEAIANLSSSRIDRWQNIPNAQPLLGSEDVARVNEIVRSDPRWERALRAHGVQDPQRAIPVSFPAGYFGSVSHGREVRVAPFYSGAGQNFLAHPIEGIYLLVSLTEGRIVDFVDTSHDIPVSRQNFDLDPQTTAPSRQALPPLNIAMPEGPGFHVEDGEVRWDRWHFRFALHPREGLVIYMAGYEDGGRIRPILYRASLSEMLVPYGDPSAGWFFRNSFDVGELGLGTNAAPLRPGLDCPMNCSVIDAIIGDRDGVPRTIRGAIGLYERDANLAWKYRENARHARELVVCSISQPGNYTYGFEWIFRQDGSMEMRISLTGLMAVKGVASGVMSPFGHPVATNLEAIHHQHFFTFRLDLDVDGADHNRVVEVNDVAAPPGPANRYGGAFVMKETPLSTEAQAKRNLKMETGRRWIVSNSSVKNSLGQPTGFALIPGENAIPLFRPDSWIAKRAGFLSSQLWVTPFDPEEIYAAGEFPNQSTTNGGLPAWTARNRKIDDTDVVLWYTVGVMHNPRPEEWPVMSVHDSGFQLIPFGFFSRNPALDLNP